jgi:hypothetical protein
MTSSQSTADNTAALISPTPEAITVWVEKYLRAWETNATADIKALFTEDAEYHESPYSTDWIGRDDIVEGWQSRWDWQQGGWTFEWNVAKVEGMTVTVMGIGHYTKLGDFDNQWTVTFDESGRSSRFDMLNTERN